MRTHVGLVLLSVALAVSGCGDAGNEGGAPARGGDDFGNAGGVGGGGGMSAGTGGSFAGDGDGDEPLPPEVEVEIDFEQPQASERYVYAANPDSGTVSIIDGEERHIQTLETGDRPTFLRTLAGTNDAIVLNVGSQDATIIRDPDGEVSLSTLDVIPGANAIAVAPDGKHAVVYFNSELSTAGNPSGSFQDVTVLTLDGEDDRATDMTVGFRPRAVFFASDSSEAFVATEDGISVLEFARVDDEGTGIARLVSLGTDIDQKTLDVAVTPDGKYALARQPGESAVRLVDLSGNEAPKHLELASLFEAEEESDEDDDGGAPDLPVEVTDLDLAPNGRLATAVLRNQSTLLVLPIPGAFDDTSLIALRKIEETIVGSATITPNGETALLYTTAAPIERLTVVDLVGEAAPRTLALRKAVQAVAVAPDSQTALVVHARAMGEPNEPGIDPDAMIDRAFGYSVVRIGSGDVKLQVTQAPPLAFTVVPDGSAVFVMFRDDTRGLREVQKIEAQSFLVTTTSLGSPPTSIGSVALTKQVFVSQEHPDGRITFIHWLNGERQTVTGFELNSRIRD